MVMEKVHEVKITFSFEERDNLKDALSIVNNICNEMDKDDNYKIFTGDENLISDWEIECAKRVLSLFSKNEEIRAYAV